MTQSALRAFCFKWPMLDMVFAIFNVELTSLAHIQALLFVTHIKKILKKNNRPSHFRRRHFKYANNYASCVQNFCVTGHMEVPEMAIGRPMLTGKQIK